MSKLFFQGRLDKREKNESVGFKTKRATKLGSSDRPLSLTVKTEQRKSEIEVQLAENKWVANITVDEDAAENIVELETVLNKPKPQAFAKTPNRNDPCSCGSGKKYKKCCG